MIEEQCYCVSKHVPLPQKLYTVKVNDEIVWLCPTTYFNMTKLLSSYKVLGTVPPGATRKHFSKFVQELVSDLYDERVDVGAAGVLD